LFRCLTKSQDFALRGDVGIGMDVFDLNRLWLWWKNEIIGLIPGDDVRKSASRAATVEVYLGQDGLEIHRRPQLKKKLPFVASSSSNDVFSNIRSRDRVIVSVAQSRCLLRHRTIPRSVLPQLNSILALDLVHSTPFSPENVLTGWFKSEAEDQRGLQPIAHVILKRDVVNPVFDAIKQRNAPIVGVAVRADRAPAKPFVTTPDGQAFGLSKQSRWLRRCAISFIVASLMAVFVGFAVFARQQETLRLYDAEIEALQEPTKRARAALEEKTKASEQRSALLRTRQQQLPVLKVIEELSALLPDGAWVQTLTGEGTTVRIEGQAQSAEPLIPLLEASPLFKEVKFTSPIFKASAESATVQFSMSMTIEGLATR
jgi:general secretion pathway protein L